MNLRHILRSRLSISEMVKSVQPTKLSNISKKPKKKFTIYKHKKTSGLPTTQSLRTIWCLPRLKKKAPTPLVRSVKRPLRRVSHNLRLIAIPSCLNLIDSVGIMRWLMKL